MVRAVARVSNRHEREEARMRIKVVVAVAASVFVGCLGAAVIAGGTGTIQARTIET